MAYKDQMRPLFEANDWDGLNAIILSTGPDHFPGSEEANQAFKDYIDVGREFGHTLDDLDAKLSVEARNIMKAVIAARNPLAQLIGRILGGKGIPMGDMSTHRATKEMCEQCQDEECTTRLAEYQAAPAPSNVLVQ
jgi:hypothetical protein